VSRTFDDGTHTYVKVNPNSLALLSASERVAYLQWLSVIIAPYLSSTAPGKVCGMQWLAGCHRGSLGLRCSGTWISSLNMRGHVGMQEYLALLRALLQMAIAIQSPVCSPAHEMALEVLISDFRAKYKRYTAGIISGVNCKRSQYAALSSTSFMKFHMLLHFVKSRRMYGPTREHDTGEAAFAQFMHAWSRVTVVFAITMYPRPIRTHQQGLQEGV
jgi:hypothetical protein